MPTPTLVQSVTLSTDASVWTVDGSVYYTELDITLPGTAVGNTIVLTMSLATLDPTFPTDGFGWLTGNIVNTDSVVFSDTTNTYGQYTTSGTVNTWWDIAVGWINPSTSAGGSNTISVQIANVGAAPASPLQLTVVANEYSDLLDAGLASNPISDTVVGANQLSAITLTDGFGATVPGAFLYVAMGATVNQTSDVTNTGGGFTTENSATGLPATGSMVYADLYSLSAGAIDLAAAGTSGNYNLGGVIGCVLVAASVLDFTASEYFYNIGDAVTLTWDTNEYTTSVSIDNGIGTVANSGSIIVHPTAPTTYTYNLTATGVGGSTTTWQAVLTFNLACTFDASEYTFNIGDAVTLSWTTENATSASIDNGIGAVALSGSTIVHPTTNVTYNLTVDGVGGSSTTCVATLSVNPPTCSLTITGITNSGLPSWQANYNYAFGSAGGGDYLSIILDPNGNYQIILYGGDGISGATIPTFATTPGDTTTDGTVTWTCVVPVNGGSPDFGPLSYTEMFAQFGTPIGLSWSSTNAISVSLSTVGTVGASGSASYVPTPATLGFSWPEFLGLGYGSTLSAYTFGPGEYTLTATNPSGTATATVYFILLDLPTTQQMVCFAPVTVATPGTEGEASALSPIAASGSYLPWQANYNYVPYDQVLDSNGNGQIALAPGISGATAPTWMTSPGDTTTETTGLSWENSGMQYPAVCIQRGFGPLWDSGQSTIGFGFEDAVIPSAISAIPTYAISTTYAAGNVVRLRVGSSWASTPGIRLLQCLQGGTTGSADPSLDSYAPTYIFGQIVADDLFNGGGGNVIWQVLGTLYITVSWLGTTIVAPDGYPVDVFNTGPIGIGLGTDFAGVPETSGILNYSDSEAFLTDPGSYDQGFYPAQSAEIPTAGEPPECPTWVSTALATGYINSACAGGFEVDVAGAWVTFAMPFSASSSDSSSSITITKETIPSGQPDTFSFTYSWSGGGTFTLMDGGSYNSGTIAPGTYSVSEAYIDGYTTTVEGADPSAIVLSTGENITVTFINSFAPTGTAGGGTGIRPIVTPVPTITQPTPPAPSPEFGPPTQPIVLPSCIDNDCGIQVIFSAYAASADYTKYTGSIQINDQINVPTLATIILQNADSGFRVPPQGSYVTIWSRSYCQYYFTGFVTSAPQLAALGTNPWAPGAKQYSYTMLCTSDEYLLNNKAVPFIPPMVGLTQGQILSRLATILAPGYLDVTSYVASGDLVPYFQYSPTNSWSQVAQQFGNQTHYHYKVINRTLYYLPYDDEFLGVEYDETRGEPYFDPYQFTVNVQSVPLLNDVIVMGITEGGNYCVDYFMGDGFTGSFNMTEQGFRTSSNLFLNEQWQSIDSNTYTVLPQGQLPYFITSEGALNILGGGGIGSTYIQYNNAIEMSGVWYFQHGSIVFTSQSSGIIGGLYAQYPYTVENCIAGFYCTPVSGSDIAMEMFPIINGAVLTTSDVTPIQVDTAYLNSYLLSTQVSCAQQYRYVRKFPTKQGAIFGGQEFDSSATISFYCSDANPDYPLTPTVNTWQFTVDVPAVVLYVPFNSGGPFGPLEEGKSGLNASITLTQIYQPPQASLFQTPFYGQPPEMGRITELVQNQFTVDSICQNKGLIEHSFAFREPPYNYYVWESTASTAWQYATILQPSWLLSLPNQAQQVGMPQVSNVSIIYPPYMEAPIPGQSIEISVPSVNGVTFDLTQELSWLLAQQIGLSYPPGPTNAIAYGFGGPAATGATFTVGAGATGMVFDIANLNYNAGVSQSSLVPIVPATTLATASLTFVSMSISGDQINVVSNADPTAYRFDVYSASDTFYYQGAATLSSIFTILDDGSIIVYAVPIGSTPPSIHGAVSNPATTYGSIADSNTTSQANMLRDYTVSFYTGSASAPVLQQGPLPISIDSTGNLFAGTNIPFTSGTLFMEVTYTDPETSDQYIIYNSLMAPVLYGLVAAYRVPVQDLDFVSARDVVTGVYATQDRTYTYDNALFIMACLLNPVNLSPYFPNTGQNTSNVDQAQACAQALQNLIGRTDISIGTTIGTPAGYNPLLHAYDLYTGTSDPAILVDDGTTLVIDNFDNAWAAYALSYYTVTTGDTTVQTNLVSLLTYLASQQWITVGDLRYNLITAGYATEPNPPHGNSRFVPISNVLTHVNVMAFMAFSWAAYALNDPTLLYNDSINLSPQSKTCSQIAGEIQAQMVPVFWKDTSAQNGVIGFAVVHDGGDGYAVGDTVTPDDHLAHFSEAVLQVATITGNGSTGPVATLNVLTGGALYAAATGVSTLTLTGTGNGLVVDYTLAAATAGYFLYGIQTDGETPDPSIALEPQTLGSQYLMSIGDFTRAGQAMDFVFNYDYNTKGLYMINFDVTETTVTGNYNQAFSLSTLFSGLTNYSIFAGSASGAAFPTPPGSCWQEGTWQGIAALSNIYQSVQYPYNSVKLPLGTLVAGQRIQQTLGFGQQNQTASITSGTNYSNVLEFYNNTIPLAQTLIELRYRKAQIAVAHVTDTSNQAMWAAIYPLDSTGVRGAILNTLSPSPRNSYECEAAGQAAITDGENPQYQGSYTITNFCGLPLFYQGPEFPISGRYLYVNAPQWSLTSDTKLVVQQVMTTVVELRKEVVQWQISYGQDTYLSKTIGLFLQPTQTLIPTDTSLNPEPQELQFIGTYYVQDLDSVLMTVLTSSSATFDIGAPPPAEYFVEVRSSDLGWGTTEADNLLGTFATQQFTLARTSSNETFYMRFVVNSPSESGVIIVQPTSPYTIWQQVPVLTGNTINLVASDVGATADLYNITLLPNQTLDVTAGVAGNFTVAHDLGTTPIVVIIQMTSGGSIVTQSVSADSANVYLTASDVGVSGIVMLWAPAPVLLTSFAAIAFTTSGAGNFDVAHGLSSTPSVIIVTMSSLGAVWLQNPTEADGTNVYLTASDTGLTGVVYVWA